MKAKLLLLTIIPLFIITACKKDQYKTKPNIEIKEIKVFEANTPNGVCSLIEIDLEVFDKEGDVKDSIFLDKFDAATVPCPGNTIDKLSFRIPEFPGSNQKALFRLKFSTIQVDGYSNVGGAQCPPRKDTSVFRFWVKDLAGNRSDTLTTPRIAIPR